MIRVEDIKDSIENLILTNREKSIKSLNGIIEQLPSEYSNLIESAFVHKRVPKEYLLSSILFTVSTSIGLTFYIDTLGYKNYANLYFIIIGSRGDAKSEAMKIAIKPIKELDDMDYNDYKEGLVGCQYEVDNEPIRKQTLIQNASIEAVHKIHSENPNSVGISMDEVYTLIEKMGNSNSRDGVAWRTFLLEGYTNGYVDVSRKTTKSFRINETYPTFLGGLQHQFVPKLFENGNLESGFIDRLLFTPKLTSNIELSRENLPLEFIEDYSYSISNILSYKRQSEHPDEDKKQFEIELSEDAEEAIFGYTQHLIERQSKALPIKKEYMAKMQISIHKLCILLFMMEHSKNAEFRSILDLDIVSLAIELNEFYFNNFQIILEENTKIIERDPSINQVIKIAKKNNASQKAVAEVMGVHKGTVSKKWNKNNQQLATSNNLEWGINELKIKQV